jgi:crotonobetainyl-CoA:carnitine CoA-transferase CaiB-like acyl-CoA transferase
MNEVANTRGPSGPLIGYRVLELCSTIAGPACARLMADFGADVIKVEPFEGDAVRDLGYHDGDTSLYAASILRNKKVVAINMKTPRGIELVRKLAAQCDVVIENFRPGTLERLGLGYDVLRELNPGIVLVRISGYGQTGPYSSKAGYGAICEAAGGVRHLTGDPDRPPSRVGLATTDYLTSIYAAYGASLALLQRQKTGLGQVIDAALYECAFSMMESIVPAYDRLKVVPSRTGSRMQSSAPNNLYVGKDGGYVLISANNDKVFRRLVEVMGVPHLVDDERFATARARAANIVDVDAAVSAWTCQHNIHTVQRLLDEAGVPASTVNTIADIFEDPHFRARDMLVEVPHPELDHLTMTGVIPKLSETPGRIHRAGPALGADTASVLGAMLGVGTAELATLVNDGVVALAGQPHQGAAQ